MTTVCIQGFWDIQDVIDGLRMQGTFHTFLEFPIPGHLPGVLVPQAIYVPTNATEFERLPTIYFAVNHGRSGVRLRDALNGGANLGLIHANNTPALATNNTGRISLRVNVSPIRPRKGCTNQWDHSSGLGIVIGAIKLML